MIGNEKINIVFNKQESALQVKQISNELIQDKNYHINLTKQRTDVASQTKKLDKRKISHSPHKK